MIWPKTKTKSVVGIWGKSSVKIWGVGGFINGPTQLFYKPRHHRFHGLLRITSELWQSHA